MLAKEVKATQASLVGDTPLARAPHVDRRGSRRCRDPGRGLGRARARGHARCSQKGWIRAVKGHGVAAEQKYKEGDGPRFTVTAETTDRHRYFGSNGRFYTIAVDRLPGGRGQGEPLRLMIDLPNEHDVVALFPHRPGLRLLVAADDGRGFIVDGEEALAQTRSGKQVLTRRPARAPGCASRPTGDAVAFVGDNRRMLIVDLADIPEMARGRGVILQRYRSGGLADARVFRLAEVSRGARAKPAPGPKPI